MIARQKKHPGIRSAICNKVNPAPANSSDPAHCPLCGRPNECLQCSLAAYKGSCWCMQVEIPEALLAQLPADLRNKSCLCRDCVMEFHRSKNAGAAPPQILPGDFYFDGGRMVFTAEYHRRRGYCCGSGCRHCPYTGKTAQAFVAG